MRLSAACCILVLFALSTLACGGGGSGGDDPTESAIGSGLLIRWQPAAEAEGYVIHWGTTSGVYEHALDVGAPVPSPEGIVSFLLEDVGTGGTIYFALTSYDAEGRMSAFSNELSAVVP